MPAPRSSGQPSRRHALPNAGRLLHHPLQVRAAADKSGEEARQAARRVAQLEVKLAHVEAQEARATEAERAATAERERLQSELIAAKGGESERQEAHAREVASMNVRWGSGNRRLPIAAWQPATARCPCFGAPAPAPAGAGPLSPNLLLHPPAPPRRSASPRCRAS